ncbi:B3 domain-containing protein [Striga asiatica]|uniref:B3 domain-containing protein n=1 Tax=Striga asiatica TaxID=4170 RepID=A0A5A7PUK1_STRAF|nr:B3 domain-containing protein [Striga asiatica]
MLCREKSSTINSGSRGFSSGATSLASVVSLKSQRIRAFHLKRMELSEGYREAVQRKSILLLIMPIHFKSFFIAISNPDERKMRLPSAVVEEYMAVVPVECKFSMRDGRTYWVRMEGDAEGVFFDNGWFQFMAFENIKSGYYLWFDRNSLTDITVTVVEENAVERPLRYPFTLEIK